MRKHDVILLIPHSRCLQIFSLQLCKLHELVSRLNFAVRCLQFPYCSAVGALGFPQCVILDDHLLCVRLSHLGHLPARSLVRVAQSLCVPNAEHFSSCNFSIVEFLQRP